MTKIHEYWNEITGMYAHFEDKKPIIEFNPTVAESLRSLPPFAK
jgi:hypothetical protein